MNTLTQQSQKPGPQHEYVAEAMGREPGENLHAFTAFREADGLRLEFKSRGINGENPAFPGIHLPEQFHDAVRDRVADATGKLVT